MQRTATLEQGKSTWVLDDDRGLPLEPPGPVVAIGATAMILGFLTSPDILIGVGLLRRSLTSEIASIRYTALVEVWLFRVLCLMVALIPLLWGWLARLSIAGRVMDHEPREWAWIDSRSALWNFSLLATLACVTVGLAYGTLGHHLFSPDQVMVIGMEDGVIEYGTAFFFLLCSIASAILAFRSRGWWMRTCVLGVFAFLFFAMCGEEISWGQRIFDLETLEVFKEHNYQQENNLHNMFGFITDHLFFVGVLVYGALFPLLASRLPFFRKLFDYVGLPIGSLGLAVGVVAVSCSPMLGLALSPPAGPYQTDPRLGAELRELLSAIFFFLLLIEIWRGAPEDDWASVSETAPA